jgi:ubiquinone/menaquinone biosynthesis C-methylase UbiE
MSGPASGVVRGLPMPVESCATTLPDDFYQQIEPRLRRRIGDELRGAQRIVDLGCGDCQLARFLAETCGRQVTGVDTANGGFPNRPDAATDTGGRLQCIKADARRLDFLDDATVDAVIMTWAFHEMTDPEAILAEAERVLRPGGELLIVDFPRDSLAQQLWHEDYYAPEEVAEMLDRARYQQVSVRLIERRQVIWARGFRPLAGGQHGARRSLR